MADDSAPLPLQHSIRTDGSTVLVAPAGEVDIQTGQPLSATLDVLTAGFRPDLVLDLRQVTFIDCGGLSLLVRARMRALNRGGRLRLVISSPFVLRVLRLAGLAEAFEVLARLPESRTPAGAAGGVMAPAAEPAAAGPRPGRVLAPA
ncbi:hypothetical protein GCM10009716_19770 [Streptomyces sodiiphilus]|uniref:Anti-sigma factor antagonist n=1 Tax=Streptomyces sodiiphilus TaxID=226217 RepID=A0ABP5AI63_9ACTN